MFNSKFIPRIIPKNLTPFNFSPKGYCSLINKKNIPQIRSINSIITSFNVKDNSQRYPQKFIPFNKLKISQTRWFSSDEKEIPTSSTPPPPPPEEILQNKETIIGPPDKKEFQTETRKLLDIVARSLYTEKEVFIRELISNSSDALEKVRHFLATGKAVENPELPLEINLFTDKTARTLTIIDTGIGMNKEELITNLGNIGHSGSSEFVKNLEKKGDLSNIIGQFGVGFYSVFMVSNSIKVYSKSAVPGNKGYCWTSDGGGSYTISEAEGVQRGTKIIIELNDKSSDYYIRETIEKIIKKYSNFVGFPIKLNGKPVNTVKALWLMNKSEITENDHREFYQFISHAYDEPMFTLHYSVDTPISIRSLFYVGQSHNEKYGMSRMESGVSLFSRKILIQQRSKLLPEWLRFVKGVVDSEDIPLNISREHLQDSSLIQRLSNVLTKRVLKWFDEEANKNPEQYNKFYEEFGSFLKEGACSDFSFKEEIAKLLRMESSKLEEKVLTSFDDYISRQDENSKEIFYLCIPSRTMAFESPYYEQFKSKNKEVLLFYNVSLDDFVLNHISEYKKKKLMSIESGAAAQALQDEKKPESEPKKSTEDVQELTKWLKEVLSEHVSVVKESKRLVDSPALVVNHGDAANYRRMMKLLDPSRVPPLGKQELEINPDHEIIVQLSQLRKTDAELAKAVANQIFDNALIAAGLLEDARGMLPRLNQILKVVTKK